MKHLLFAITLSLFGGVHLAYAQEEAETDADPVFVFNSICYSQIPNIGAIEDMALELLWRKLSDEALEEMKTVDNPDVLLGWDTVIGERVFRVVLNQSPPTSEQLETFPDFAGGTTTSCSLILDPIYPADLILTNMQTLAGKEPISADVAEGVLSSTTWAGGNDDIKVFLIAKVNTADGGGLLHVTVMQK